MEKRKLRIALIALEEDVRRRYQDLLSGYDYLALEAYSTIQEFKNACPGKLYSGFIVDMRTLIRSSTLEKEFFASLHEGFPVLQVRDGGDSMSFNCLVQGRQPGDLRGEQLLDYFLRRDCWEMKPRQVRLMPRRNIFLNTHLYLKEDGEPIRTNLWDISEGGCFILSTEEMKRGRPVWLTIRELSDQSPIRSEVKWAKPWGTAPSHLPGLGVSFTEISHEQRMEIKKTMEN